LDPAEYKGCGKVKMRDVCVFVEGWLHVAEGFFMVSELVGKS